MVNLSVHLNKIAVLRNSRGGNIPDVLQAARTVIDAGCQGITVHPRPDGRHIKRSDVLDLAQMVSAEFNIEGYPSPDFLDLVFRVRRLNAPWSRLRLMRLHRMRAGIWRPALTTGYARSSQG